MKIYTRTGDDGTTGLLGGQRVSKAELRVEAYGSVDEALSALGVVRATAGLQPDLDGLLAEIQADLFTVGSSLATPPGEETRGLALPEDRVQALEGSIDRLSAGLPEARRFILPGGSPAGASLLWARTVVRRAERRVAQLAQVEGRDPGLTLRYLNRLSDLLFIMGRAANHRAGQPEVIWPGRAGARGGDPAPGSSQAP